jgi:hypothetical protein
VTRRIRVLFLVLAWAWVGWSFGAPAALAQNLTPADAEASARALAKPVLLLWQAGANAPSFTEQFDRILASWPRWAAQASLLAEITRARGWEGPLPPSYPLADIPTDASALVLWVPGQAPTVWIEVPPVVTLSQTLAEASGRHLDPPYDVEATAFEWDEGTMHRVYDGPWWRSDEAEGAGDWVEEGPVGTVLVLKEPATGRRAAFPLDGDWSFLFDAVTQSWEPWHRTVARTAVSR